jgi:hypothetical protein
VVGEKAMGPNYLTRQLRAMIRDRFQQLWEARPSQGRFAKTLGLHSAANIIADPHLPFCDTRFIHKARVCLLPTNGRPGNVGDRRCRKCGHELESQSHVLSNCRHHSRLWIKRHDAIITALTQMVTHPFSRLDINKAFIGVRSAEGRTLRPDIVAVDVASGKNAVVDVKCSTDYAAVFQRNEADMVAKYRPIAEHLNCPVLTLNVGALGSWSPDNNAVLRALHIPHYKWRETQQRCVRAAIHWSRNIWVTHCGSAQLI